MFRHMIQVGFSGSEECVDNRKDVAPSHRSQRLSEAAAVCVDSHVVSHRYFEG